MERNVLDLGFAKFLFEFKAPASKIKEQADVFSSGGQVINQLNFMLNDDAGDCFQFDNEFSIYNQIGFKITYNYAFITNLYQSIGFNLKTGLCQFIKQRFLINRFEKAWTECAMNFHREADDLAVQILI
jgi:hypothetical protein